MSKNEVKKIVKKYAKKLQEENFFFSSLYLFGSYVNGDANQWSDIDVAVISDQIKKNTAKNRLLLWQLRRDIDLRIEPHPFTLKDFQDQTNPLAHEIKKTGIKIA
ncbi:hypothetical protein MNBD_UNCLBAC01-1202 [hydrothermal vent metagenome]|uniref:Polymerase beta nucleotidyltransferase domain-containing protein n=1 Tax=hydrothermal vent metagenome TaxID=652676 RepID=A0A3B1D3C2_9ZZZZ